MQVRLLGPVQVLAPTPVVLGGVRHQLLLAVLVAAADKPVSRDALLADVWDDRRATADRLRVLVTELRTALQPHNQDRPDLIPNATGGTYRARFNRAEVDVHRFHDQVRKAQAATTARSAEAVGLWQNALAEWGDNDECASTVEPLAGVSGRWAEQYRQTLMREHRAARSAYWDLLNRLDRTEHTLPAIGQFLQANPTDERIAAIYVESLYRAGRQPDAHNAWKATTRALQRSGITPTPQFAQLHQRVSRHDPALRGRPDPGPTAPPGPGHAPHHPTDRTGPDTDGMTGTGTGEESATDTPPSPDQSSGRAPDAAQPSFGSVVVSGQGGVFTGGTFGALHIGNVGHTVIATPEPTEWDERR
jgi:DNA-binding SARP family transcriptional activator